jgi:hypothetical protein
MRHYQSFRRHTVARTVLDMLAMLFLGASLAFWGVLHWTVLFTPAPYLPQAIVSGVMTIVYALALPLLLSMLVPTTPAGQLLQKTQLRTVGFPVIIASAAFLGWHARNLMLLWFEAQPAIADAGQGGAYTIAALIGFVVIPALAWVQVSPERWVQQIQQAHQVKKLELQQRGELAIIKASLIRAETLAARGWANLLPAEQEEAYQSLRGLLMASSDSMRAVVKTLGLSADLERSIMSDEDIAAELDYVRERIDVVPDIPHRDERTSTIAIADSPHVVPTPQSAPHVDSRPGPPILRETPDDARRHMTPDDAAYARAAYAALGVRPWTIKQLSATLQVGETSARWLRDRWLAADWVKEVNLGRWYFTESMEK